MAVDARTRGNARAEQNDPLVLVVGSDLDSVADVAAELEAWGHDPIVQFDVDGVPNIMRRVRPDAVVAIGVSAAGILPIVLAGAGVQIIAYLPEGPSGRSRMPAGVTVVRDLDHLRVAIDGESSDDAVVLAPSDLDQSVAVSPAVPATDTDARVTDAAVEGVGASTGVPTTRAAGWVRLVITLGALIMIASLLFAPPSEENPVTDDAPAADQKEDQPEPVVDVAALGIPTMAPPAVGAAVPKSAQTGKSGFAGQVVLRDGGAPVPDAKVTISGPSGVLHVDADADGRWRVAEVRGGLYAVEATANDLDGAPVQILIGEGQVINSIRVVVAPTNS